MLHICWVLGFFLFKIILNCKLTEWPNITVEWNLLGQKYCFFNTFTQRILITKTAKNTSKLLLGDLRRKFPVKMNSSLSFCTKNMGGHDACNLMAIARRSHGHNLERTSPILFNEVFLENSLRLTYL